MSPRLVVALVRDWLHGLIDRFVEFWIRRSAARVALGVERWMRDNADRE